MGFSGQRHRALAQERKIEITIDLSVTHKPRSCDDNSQCPDLKNIEHFDLRSTSARPGQYAVFVACAVATVSAEYQQPYYGPQHVPVIQNGVPVEPPEVQKARSAHLAAFGGAPQYPAAPANQYNAPPAYNQGPYNVPSQPIRQTPPAYQTSHVVPAIGNNGVPLDTPEVNAAKANHFAAYSQQHAALGQALTQSQPAGHGGYGGHGHYRRKLQHAKAAHFAAVAEASSRAGAAGGAYDDGSYHGGYDDGSYDGRYDGAYDGRYDGAYDGRYDGGYGHGGGQWTGPIHIPVIDGNGVPVEPPAVQHARAAHLAAVGDAAARSGAGHVVLISALLAVTVTPSVIIPYGVTIGLTPYAHPIQSLYHAQDTHGQYVYGYATPTSTKTEAKSIDGVTRGGYSYIDSHGILQSVEYSADPVHGFRVAATNLPQDLPDVAHAKAKHLAEYETIKAEHLAARTVQYSNPVAVPYAADLPEVAAAKAKHLAEYEAIKAQHLSQAQVRFPQQLSGHVVPVQTANVVSRPIAVVAKAPVLSYSPLYYASHQFQTQDNYGQYSYGYAEPLSAKTETRTADGVTRGGYSYIDANGVLQTVHYIADPVNGFRVAATNLPVQHAVSAAVPLAKSAAVVTNHDAQHLYSHTLHY
ncbi:structural contituent of cuticle [Holotrichia oblita]|uniref:Structural contituent of cuticle n=1 Tax=Holotrichia oblita TaxID=644536 RepID=A0ACB9T4J2_HOLOL|nr:structural contituent of cuticle [Holotrichia oblita]